MRSSAGVGGVTSELEARMSFGRDGGAAVTAAEGEDDGAHHRRKR
jgi:hypothetical protein